MFTALIVASTGAGRDGATRVATTLARRSGLVVEPLTVVGDVDVAAEIVEHVRSRDGALLLMTTGATTLVTDVRQSVTARILAGLCQPVLILGPHCVEPVREPTLLVAVDHEHAPQPAAQVVQDWCRMFGGRRPQLVDVVATSGWPAGSTDAAMAARKERTVEAFAAHGVDGDLTVIHTGDPVAALVQLGEQVGDAVFVLTSERWPGGRSHWYSTTRHLLQRSWRPVLVVPADLPTG